MSDYMTEIDNKLVLDTFNKSLAILVFQCNTDQELDAIIEKVSVVCNMRKEQLLSKTYTSQIKKGGIYAQSRNEKVSSSI